MGNNICGDEKPLDNSEASPIDFKKDFAELGIREPTFEHSRDVNGMENQHVRGLPPIQEDPSGEMQQSHGPIPKAPKPDEHTIMTHAKENPNVLATLQKLGEDFNFPKPSEYEEGPIPNYHSYHEKNFDGPPSKTIHQLKDSYLISELEINGEVSKAKQVWQDGTILEGRYENGKFNGLGRIVHSNGDYYIGHFVNNLAEGNGTFESATGYYYQGEFEKNRPHGIGSYYNTNGESYTGDLMDGKMDGYGKFIQQSRGEYNGNFSDNKFHGVGTYKWLDGRIYEGHWSHGKMHGVGCFTFKDGGSYKGSYDNGKKNGYGTLMVSNGVGYEGYWKDNQYSGVGVLRQADEILLEGDWESGHFVPIDRK